MLSADSTDDGGWSLGLKAVAGPAWRRMSASFDMWRNQATSAAMARTTSLSASAMPSRTVK
jgi:hypothetical protein